MKVTTLEEIIGPLLEKRQFFFENFGVIRMGVFGSFAQGTQQDTSDIDIVVEIVKEKKNRNYSA